MWSNQHLTVYHGCDDVSARRIVTGGVALGSGIGQPNGGLRPRVLQHHEFVRQDLAPNFD